MSEASRGPGSSETIQVAVVGFYVVAGLAGGQVFFREALRRAQRDEVIRRAYLAEQAAANVTRQPETKEPSSGERPSSVPHRAGRDAPGAV